MTSFTHNRGTNPVTIMVSILYELHVQALVMILFVKILKTWFKVYRNAQSRLLPILSFALFCSVLLCTVLFFIVPFCSVLRFTLLYYILFISIQLPSMEFNSTPLSSIPGSSSVSSTPLYSIPLHCLNRTALHYTTGIYAPLHYTFFYKNQ